MPSGPLPIVHAWHSRFGLVEHYDYPPARAETAHVHAHREMQICLSLDFPGRYTYRGRHHEVPIGAVSVLDAWEPHAASDPIDRHRHAHYIVLYVDARHLRAAVDRPSAGPLEVVVHTDPEVATRFERLHRALASSEDSVLEQDERYRELGHALVRGADEPMAVVSPAGRSLIRARDFIAAHAAARIGLEEIAAVADLTPWHFARAFRQRFGISPHRFQLSMRIDLARGMLADGMSGGEIAQRIGFADQSHFIRAFKRLTGTTPSKCMPLQGVK
jgi:AraC-like DNA-binding protein